MAISRNGLKTYFENGKKPTAAQFAALIDSFFHLDDNLGGTNAPFATVPQATAGFDDTTYMSPFLVYEAMKVLVRLTNIPALSTEVDNKISSAINDLLTLNDADTVINTVKEVIDAFNGLNEGDTLVALLQGKADASHTHTPAQVGLGNLPNAKSNSTSLNDANTLATSKAVFLNNQKIELSKDLDRTKLAIETAVSMDSTSGSAPHNTFYLEEYGVLSGSVTYQNVGASKFRITHNFGSLHYQVAGTNEVTGTVSGVQPKQECVFTNKTANYIDVSITSNGFDSGTSTNYIKFFLMEGGNLY